MQVRAKHKGEVLLNGPKTMSPCREVNVYVSHIWFSIAYFCFFWMFSSQPKYFYFCRTTWNNFAINIWKELEEVGGRPTTLGSQVTLHSLIYCASLHPTMKHHDNAHRERVEDKSLYGMVDLSHEWLNNLSKLPNHTTQLHDAFLESIKVHAILSLLSFLLQSCCEFKK